MWKLGDRLSIFSQFGFRERKTFELTVYHEHCTRRIIVKSCFRNIAKSLSRPQQKKFDFKGFLNTKTQRMFYIYRRFSKKNPSGDVIEGRHPDFLSFLENFFFASVQMNNSSKILVSRRFELNSQQISLCFRYFSSNFYKKIMQCGVKQTNMTQMKNDKKYFTVSKRYWKGILWNESMIPVTIANPSLN